MKWHVCNTSTTNRVEGNRSSHLLLVFMLMNTLYTVEIWNHSATLSTQEIYTVQNFNTLYFFSDTTVIWVLWLRPNPISFFLPLPLPLPLSLEKKWLGARCKHSPGKWDNPLYSFSLPVEWCYAISLQFYPNPKLAFMSSPWKMSASSGLSMSILGLSPSFAPRLSRRWAFSPWPMAALSLLVFPMLTFARPRRLLAIARLTG